MESFILHIIFKSCTTDQQDLSKFHESTSFHSDADHFCYVLTLEGKEKHKNRNCEGNMQETGKSVYISRRSLVKVAGVTLMGAGALSAGLAGTSAIAAEPAMTKNDITPDQELKKLMAGNQRFVEGKVIAPNRSMARLREIAKGQKPSAAFLSCADSRVPIEILFDQGFGDTFVCRVAGCTATAEETGSLEYGAAVLGVKVLMVLGHEYCGAVKAELEGEEVPGSIAAVLDQVKPAIAMLKDKKAKGALDEAIANNVKLQVAKLGTSPVLSALVKEGKLKIVGAVYDLDEGKVKMLA
jgi:carbonic anhydrase